MSPFRTIRIVLAILFIGASVFLAVFPDKIFPSVDIHPIDLNVAYDVGYNQKLVYGQGDPTIAKWEDPQFKIEIDGLSFNRIVEKYKENPESGEVYWEKLSADNTQESLVPPYSNAVKEVLVGKFTLSEELSAQLMSKQEPLPITEAVFNRLNIFARKAFKLNDGALFFGLDPLNPKVDDMRIRYTYTPIETISVLAQQYQDTLVVYRENNENTGLATHGRQTLEEILHSLPQKLDNNLYLLASRALGGLLGVIALLLIIGIFKSRKPNESSSDEGILSYNVEELESLNETSKLENPDDYIPPSSADKLSPEDESLLNEKGQKHAIGLNQSGLSAIEQLKQENEAFFEDEETAFEKEEDISFDTAGPQALVAEEDVAATELVDEIASDDFSPFDTAEEDLPQPVPTQVYDGDGSDIDTQTSPFDPITEAPEIVEPTETPEATYDTEPQAIPDPAEQQEVDTAPYSNEEVAIEPVEFDTSFSDEAEVVHVEDRNIIAEPTASEITEIVEPEAPASEPPTVTQSLSAVKNMLSDIEDEDEDFPDILSDFDDEDGEEEDEDDSFLIDEDDDSLDDDDIINEDPTFEIEDELENQDAFNPIAEAEIDNTKADEDIPPPPAFVAAPPPPAPAPATNDALPAPTLAGKDSDLLPESTEEANALPPELEQATKTENTTFIPAPPPPPMPTAPAPAPEMPEASQPDITNTSDASETNLPDDLPPPVAPKNISKAPPPPAPPLPPIFENTTMLATEETDDESEAFPDNATVAPSSAAPKAPAKISQEDFSGFAEPDYSSDSTGFDLNIPTDEAK